MPPGGGGSSSGGSQHWWHSRGLKCRGEGIIKGGTTVITVAENNFFSWTAN